MPHSLLWKNCFYVPVVRKQKGDYEPFTKKNKNN